MLTLFSRLYTPDYVRSSCARLCSTIALSSILFACGGGGSSNTSPELVGTDGDSPQQVETTDLMISLTDAEGDFLTYVVDVTDITMLHRNGTVVDVMPEAATVDFAQYVDVSELLRVHSAPLGAYQSASLTINFDDAQITVQNEEGDPITALPVDSEGNPLTSATVELSFNGDDDFVLSRGVIKHVTLDFDLDASNVVEIEAGTAMVMVEPVWHIDGMQSSPKPFRVRGLVDEVSVENSQFIVDLRPFRKHRGNFGEATLNVNEETHFDVNGDVALGEEGLVALDALGENTPVVVMTEWNSDRRRLLATQVLAGSSVPWAEHDIARGTVISRDESSAVVRGALLELADGRFVFRDEMTISFNDETAFKKFGDDDANVSDVSVGSALRVIGEVVDDRSIAATQVRIVRGVVTGLVTQEDPLAIDLQLVNGRRVGLYDFSGTGASIENDADPDAYDIDTGDLNVTAFSGDPVRIRGFVSEFGTAPADYVAHSVANHTAMRAHLVTGFGMIGSATALMVDDADQIVINIEHAEGRHHLIRAGIYNDLQSLNTVPTVFSTADHGMYSIAQGVSIEVFRHYADFIAALSEHIADERAVKRIDVHGAYDMLDSTIDANVIRVSLVRSDL